MCEKESERERKREMEMERERETQRESERYCVVLQNADWSFMSAGRMSQIVREFICTILQGTLHPSNWHIDGVLIPLPLLEQSYKCDDSKMAGYVI